MLFAAIGEADVAPWIVVAVSVSMLFASTVEQHARYTLLPMVLVAVLLAVKRNGILVQGLVDHGLSSSLAGWRETSTLSTRLPSRSTTSKRQPLHSTTSVVTGRRPSSSMIMPARVL